MKVHTNNFKESIKLQGRQLDSKITYEIEGETIELGAEELNSVTPHYEGAILKSVMKQLDIDSNVDIPLETIVNYQFGVFVDKYCQTTDETYQADTDYYSYEDNEYTLLVAGTDYTVGDSITGTIYNYQDYEYLDFGNYVVYSSEKQEDTNSYKIVCYDKMLYSMIDYEAMSITYPITIRDYISAICTKLGLTFKNSSDEFANWNRTIPYELYLDNGGNSLNYKFRDVLDELAQVTASTICIDKDDNLEIRYITDTNDTIDEEYLKDINVNFGEQYGPVNSIVLSRSAETDNVYLQDAQSIADNGLTEIKIIDNQIMNFNDRSDYLNDILVKLDGLQYYLNDYSSTGIGYYDLCDRYNVSIGENIYSCVMFNNDFNVTQGLEELIHTDMPEETETDYSKADKTDRKINQTYLVVDKQNQTISSVVSTVTEQNNKISQITQSVDELNSKIQDIADITITGETNFATVELNNINQSEPIMIKVKPLVNNISYLYPRSNLYPASTQYMPTRKIRFTNTSTNEVIDYELPDDLLIYNSSIYDEFYLDYDSQTCQVTKRCEYNADGTISALANERTDTYIYPTIPLTDGDYTITLLGYSDAYLFVRLMASNIYTSQFATKVEVSSEISQTAQEINIEVAKKTNKDEIISAINLTPETATINASKISLAGKNIDLTGQNISISSNNFNVDSSGNLTCSNANINGGKLNIAQSSSQLTPPITLLQTTNDNITYGVKLSGGGLRFTNNTNDITLADLDIYTSSSNNYGRLRLYNNSGVQRVYASGNNGTIQLYDENNLRYLYLGKYIQLYDSSGTGTIDLIGASGTINCRNLYTTNLVASGNKNRVVNTKKGKKVLLNAYETTTPYFGDIGSNKTDNKGYCKIEIEDIFSQTIEKDDYKVFIQECGEGKLYVEKKDTYFEVKGTPNLDFDWELKAIQKGYKNTRLEEYKERESDK